MIASLQPFAFLNIFLEQNAEPNYRVTRIFSNESNYPNPILRIKDEVIIEWCNVDAELRYPLMAAVIVPYQMKGKGGLLGWTPLAMELINNSPDPLLVLSKFKSTFRPSSWSGLRSGIMQDRLPLLLELQKHENNAIVTWANQEEKIFVSEIISEREWELKNERERNERFE